MRHFNVNLVLILDATFHSSLNTSRMCVPKAPGVEDKRLSRLIRKGKEYTQNPIVIVLLAHPRTGQRVHKTLLL